jgi:hypothetical protein
MDITNNISTLADEKNLEEYNSDSTFSNGILLIMMFLSLNSIGGRWFSNASITDTKY